jgi:tetratricopeptide (TPR) repeat protein
MDDILPTFLLEAESLLQEGKARESAVLCTRGLVKYPMYKTAYIVLIRALNELGDTVQINEVYDDAPNFVKYNQTVKYMMNNLGSAMTKQADKVVELSEDDEEVDSLHESTSNATKESELSNEVEEVQPIVESAEDLEAEITDALKNDELNPNVIESLTKTSDVDSELESTDVELKETLTLAKIYEQQDAYQQALDIYLELQKSAGDEELYADKIVELKAIIEEESG